MYGGSAENVIRLFCVDLFGNKVILHVSLGLNWIVDMVIKGITTFRNYKSHVNTTFCLSYDKLFTWNPPKKQQQQQQQQTNKQTPTTIRHKGIGTQ